MGDVRQGGDVAKKKKPFGRNPGRWLTKRLGEAQNYMKSATKQQSSRRGDERGRAGVFGEGDEDPAARAVTAAATSAAHSVDAEQGPTSTPGREGVGAQVKVLVNRKVYKEFTEMRLIQTIHARARMPCGR